MPRVLVIHATHEETVEIQWRLSDDTTHVTRVTCPPAATIAARRPQPGNAAIVELASGPHVVPREL